MIATYLLVKAGTLLLTMVLPIAGPAKKPKRPYIPLSDLAVNEKGQLIDLSEETHTSHPIKLKH